MNSIKLEQVCKQIGEFKLGPMNVAIPAGSSVAIIGDNGAGKSTLLKMIMGLAKEDSGHIQLFDQDRILGDSSWKERIAYQPQTVSGCSGLKGSEIKKLIARFSSSFDEERFSHYVDKLNIPLNKRFDKLSQGVQKKLTLALTLAQPQDLMIFDEPMAAIDLMAQKLVIDEMVQLMDEHLERTIIFTSHQLHDIRKFADYLLLIRQGEFLGMFEKDDLASKFTRYWLDKPLEQAIPYILTTSDDRREIISYKGNLTEQALHKSDIRIIRKANVGLDETLPAILSGELDLKNCHDQHYAGTI
ncbi:ABC transporter ATP-binding protein [Bacillus sp. REN10]|uniref:ATP-binding cassette domain-containing protein n=1 Tax=Bacillus sp. REN10 TaxID=2782541 RepID=UPI00193B5CAE|nr:ABC transporter ATP-binding protein [Bacillus sp. REN10]